MRGIAAILTCSACIFYAVYAFMPKEKYHTKIGNLFCFFAFMSVSFAGTVVTSMSLYYKSFYGDMVLGGIFMIVLGGEILEQALMRK